MRPYMMSLSIEQQAVEQISRAKNILIITREHPNADALFSVYVIGRILNKINKTHDIVIPGWNPSRTLELLPSAMDIRSELDTLRATHIVVDVKDTKLAELLYGVNDGKLDITIVPKSGQWQEKNITVKPGEDRYDLVIAVDMTDIATFGKSACSNLDFFLRTNVIVIDSHAQNEHWGQVNLVDINTVSTTEVVYHWLQAWNQNFIDEEIATALLAGMIAKSKNFRSSLVTPHTLSAASKLVELGARRGWIADHLWRTRELPALKLWGRAMARLEQDVVLGIVWTVLLETDFFETTTSPNALNGVVDEMISYIPNSRVIVVCAHQKNDMLVHVYTSAQISAVDLVRQFGGSGTKEGATFVVTGISQPQAAVAHIIEQLKTMLPARI